MCLYFHGERRRHELTTTGLYRPLISKGAKGIAHFSHGNMAPMATMAGIIGIPYNTQHDKHPALKTNTESCSGNQMCYWYAVHLVRCALFSPLQWEMRPSL